MTLPVVTRSGSWVTDRRGRHRGLRISGHPECGTITLSVWRDGVCTGTVRLDPAAAAEAVRALSAELAALVPAGTPAGSCPAASRPVTRRLPRVTTAARSCGAPG